MPTNYINNTKCPSCNSNAITFDEKTSHAKCSVCGLTVHKIFMDAINQLDDEVLILTEKLTFAISAIAKSDRVNTVLANVISEFKINHPEFSSELDSIFKYHSATTPIPVVEIHEKLPTTVTQ